MSPFRASTGVASSEGALYHNSFGALFRYGSPVSGTVAKHVGASAAWAPRIIDTGGSDARQIYRELKRPTVGVVGDEGASSDVVHVT
ncbi:hypothetical protein TNCV_3634271 [Trichonephila clavipes]|nr:hypothetical protein TNCV_3634271 [Trichonephila clavipes]